MITAFRAYISQNPIVGRLLVTRYTGPALGFAFLLVTGALLVADVIVLANTSALGGAGGMEAGTMLHGVHCLVLTGLITLLVPLKVAGSGALDGLRADRALDQLVVTGISPVRYSLGNFALGWLYGLSLLLVSLPFEMHAWLLGGVSLGAIVVGMGVLTLYSGFLVVVTLGMAIREPERHAAMGVIVLGLLAGSLAFAPLPPVVAEATPVRFFLRQDPAWIRLVELDPLLVLQDPVLFFWKVPLEVHSLVLWGFLCLPFVLLVVSGPSHRFQRGEDNFGGSTPRGAARDRWLATLSGGLARRVDLAFLYENRPRWLDGWSVPLRYVTALLFVVAVWSVIVGITFPGGSLNIVPRRGYYADQPFLALMITGSFVAFAFLFCGDTFFRERWRVRCWGWKLRRGLLFTLCALVLVAAFGGLHLGILTVAEHQERSAIYAEFEAQGSQLSLRTFAPLVGGTTASQAAQDLRDRELARLEEYGTTGRWVIASAVLLLLNAHFLGKVLTYFAPVAFLWRFTLLCGMGLLLVGPIFLLRAMEEDWAPWSLQPLTFLSPFVLGSGRTWHVRKDEAIFYQNHVLALAVLLGVLLLVWLLLSLALRWIARRSRRRDALAGTKAGTTALVLLLSVLTPGGVRAQSAAGKGRLPVELQAVHAFEGRLFQERVDFVTLVVNNKGTETLRGTVRLDVGWDGPFQRIRKFIEAPPGTTTVVRWTEVYDRVFEEARWRGRVLLETSDGVVETDLDPLDAGPSVLGKAPGPAVVVVDDRDPDARGSLPARRGLVETWSVCRSVFLPEENRAYAGIDTVIVAGSDLTRWTDTQRMALYDHVRNGGTVIFSGDPRMHGLSSCVPWGSALPLTPLSRPGLPGVELAPNELEDGYVAWALDSPGSDVPVPLLTVRTLGPGRAGHLSFDVLAGGWPAGLELGDDAWNVLEQHLPMSRHPSSLLRVGVFTGTGTPEGSWLFTTLAYFGPYVLLMGPGLMVAFARRRRRRWLPVAVIGLPAAFLLGLPWLGAFLASRPSGALVSEVAVFGPGSRRGVTHATVSLQSRGRQEHEVVLAGEALSAFALRDRSRTTRRGPGALRLPEDSRSAQTARQMKLTGDRLQFRLSPWGERRFRVLTDLELERPVEGTVIYDSRRKELQVRVKGLPGVAPGAPVFIVCCNVVAQGSRHSFSLKTAEGGEIGETFELEPVTHTPLSLPVTLDFPQRTLGNLGGSFRIPVSDQSPPVVFVVVALRELPVTVTADGAVFEAEVGPGPDMPTAQARRIRARLRTHIEQGGRDLEERDSRFFLDHRVAALVQEFRVTVR